MKLLLKIANSKDNMEIQFAKNTSTPTIFVNGFEKWVAFAAQRLR